MAMFISLLISQNISNLRIEVNFPPAASDLTPRCGERGELLAGESSPSQRKVVSVCWMVLASVADLSFGDLSRTGRAQIELRAAPQPRSSSDSPNSDFYFYFASSLLLLLV